ncbi:MAG: hypothetical protein JNL43_04450 [Flavobacteriales bacterium]|nr:hypothetical protein [Flavobacteriales bacterium]
MKRLISFLPLLAFSSLHAQTVSLVKDINPGSASSMISTPMNWNGRLSMSATTAAAGAEPWSTDGMNSTSISSDIWSGVQSSNPRYPVVFMDHLVFVARKNGTLGDRLFAIPNGSSVVHEVVPVNVTGAYGTEKATEILGLHVHQSKLYVATNANGTGVELHVWQTTPGPAYFGGSVRSGNTGNVGNAGGTGGLGSIGDALGGAPPPVKEWYWLGILRDIHPTGESAPESFVTYNDKIYFTADNGTNGRELWVTDGTSAGTTLVKDIWPGTNTSGISAFVLMNSKLYFTADDGVKGRELWVTDGTTAGTVMVRDINIRNGQTLALIGSPNSESSNPTGLHVWKNKLYFSASNGTGGQELWSSDGTSAGTVLIKDINPNGGSNPKNFSGYIRQGQDPVTNQIVNQQYLSFAANDGTTGEELWRTDGTAAGTVLLKDVKAGTAGSSPSELRGLNTSTTAGAVSYTHYYYSAIGGNNGRELWEFHPLTNTHKKISPAVAPNPDPLKDSGRWPWVAMGTALYFYANFDSNGGELWKVTRP